MYKQIKTLKSFIQNDLLDVLESSILSLDFFTMAEKLLTDTYDEEDADVDKIELLHDFLEITQFIEEDTEFDSIIDDETYDRLAEKYRNLTGKAITGTDLEVKSSNRPMKKHLYPELVGTLDKLHFPTDDQIPEKDSRHSLEEWITSIFNKCESLGIPVEELTIANMFKYDGLSVVLECKKQMVMGAVTRRDTNEGVGLDVSHIFKYKEVKALAPQLPNDVYNHNFGLKTEVYMTQEQYESFSKIVPKKLSHRRSAVSKIINTLEESYDSEWFNYITIAPLQISVSDFLSLTPEEYDKWLYAGVIDGRHMYINIEDRDCCPTTINVSKNTIDSFIHWECDQTFQIFINEANKLGIPIDGTVLTILNKDIIDALGRKDSINKFQVAYKFPAGEAKTKLVRVDFQVGPIAGNITPVAIVEPVVIGGATIDHATLSNYVKLKRLNLHEGDEVIIRYDIVPKLMKDDSCKLSNRPQILGPTECPICDEPLNLTTDIPRCVNPNCDSKLIGRVTNYLAKTGVLGVGISTVMDFVQRGFIQSIPDVYRLEDFRNEIVQMQGYGEKSYNNIMKAINTRRTFYPHEILGSIGIPDVGRTIMKKICSAIPMNELLSDDPNIVTKMVTINGIGEKTALKICQGIERNRELIGDLLRYVELKPYVANISDHVVLFTQIRDAAFARYLEEKCNCEIASSLTKNVDILIAGGHSAKVDKAKERGIDILTLDEAYERFGYEKDE